MLFKYHPKCVFEKKNNNYVYMLKRMLSLKWADTRFSTRNWLVTSTDDKLIVSRGVQNASTLITVLNISNAFPNNGTNKSTRYTMKERKFIIINNLKRLHPSNVRSNQSGALSACIAEN